MLNNSSIKFFVIGLVILAIAAAYRGLPEKKIDNKNSLSNNHSNSEPEPRSMEPALLATTTDQQHELLSSSPNETKPEAKSETKAKTLSEVKADAQGSEAAELAYQRKKSYSEDKIKQALEEMNSHTEGENKAELMQVHADSIKTRQQMKSAAQNGDWKHFLETKDSLNDLMGAGDLLSLLDAIQFGAPEHVFRELLRTGSQFTPDMLMYLVMNDDLSLVKMLMSLGFDIHMKDRYDKNALLYSIEFNAPNVFAFLLSQNVAVQPSIHSLDALDTALEMLLKPHNSSLLYVDVLLNANFPIQASHQHLFSLLAKKRPEIYREITTQHSIH